LLTGSNLNDYFWHTLYIRRRANDVHAWIDEEPMSVGIIGGENYKLLIDRIKFGAVGDTGEFNANNFIGYMQNFIYNDMELFELLKKQNPYSQWLVNMTYDNLPLITYNAVTITTSGSYFQLPDLFGLNMKIVFKFKTRESNGLILYNAGTGNDLTAIELSNGKIRLVLGGKNKCTVVLSHSQVNDNTWHTVMMSLKEKGQLSVRVDKDNIDVSNSDDDGRLDMSG
jgi:leucine-rich repeat transmembrane neuronal protein 1/2